jgi:hypothetical protein
VSLWIGGFLASITLILILWRMTRPRQRTDQRLNERNQLLAALRAPSSSQTRLSRLHAAKSLREFADAEVAGAVASVWDAERLYGNGMAQECRDSLATMGEIAVEPLVDWLRRQPEVEVGRFLAQVGNALCHQALLEALERVRARLDGAREGYHAYYDEWQLDVSGFSSSWSKSAGKTGIGISGVPSEEQRHACARAVANGGSG